MVALCFAGFAFCWWARIHLGRLWSAFVTLKAEHRIVDTGPYGIVRHPIYTGIILATVAVGILKGTAYAAAGALLVILGFWIKARLEELGAVPMPMSPTQFGQLVADDTAKWAKVIKDAGIKPE